eukprot:7181596-Pyramimonas_sp.AAC.1
MHPRASSSVVGLFSKIQAAGYSSCMCGRGADADGMFINVSSSARMPIWSSVFTINATCSMSPSDIALVPLRAPTGLSVLRLLRGRVSRSHGT